jgi:hypothetical protein
VSKRKDGGPAFPNMDDAEFESGSHSPVLTHGGMSLRDWFAGQALAGLSEEPLGINTAKWAYELADAMLAERAKGGE